MIDDLDRRLIALLRADSRTPAANLAKALKVSRGTVQNRIERLQARGVVQGFTIRTKPELEVYHGGQFWVSDGLIDKGLLQPPYVFQLVLGTPQLDDDLFLGES